jgi:hypothetical protein
MCQNASQYAEEDAGSAFSVEEGAWYPSYLCMGMSIVEEG